MALSHSFPLWSMYGGMAQIPFHLNNKKGDIVTFPSHYCQCMVEWQDSPST